MIQAFLILSLVLFVLFLVPSKYKKYFAAGGWTFLGIFFVLFSFSHVTENEYIYPLAAALSIPLFVTTIAASYSGNRTAFRITTVAAVAFIIYSVIAPNQAFSEWLIRMQVDNTILALAMIGHPAEAPSWDCILSNGYGVIITLSCTPIVGTAIMLGMASGGDGNLKQKITAAGFVVLSLALLNVVRIAFVVKAYSEQWFPYFTDISGGFPGHESFFWAHNVIGRISFTFLAIILVGWGLTYFIPDIKEFYREILYFYYDGLKNISKGRIR
jgi:archaeosortase A